MWFRLYFVIVKRVCPQNGVFPLFIDGRRSVKNEKEANQSSHELDAGANKSEMQKFRARQFGSESIN